jgi:hypothetical protein
LVAGHSSGLVEIQKGALRGAGGGQAGVADRADRWRPVVYGIAPGALKNAGARVPPC